MCKFIKIFWITFLVFSSFSSNVYAGLNSSVILPEFQTIVREIKQKNQIPVLVPTWIPVTLFTQPQPPSEEPYPLKGGKMDAFFPELSEVNSDKYVVSFFKLAECIGATGTSSCQFGYVSGEKLTSKIPQVPEDYSFYIQYYREHQQPGQSPILSPESPSRVSLAFDIKGWFIPYVCGASCTSSQVIWDLNGYRYTVAIQQASKEVVIKMANSAILNQ